MGVQDINGKDNIQIIGDGNTIISNKKKKIVLEPIYARIRNQKMDYLWGAICYLIVVGTAIYIKSINTTYITLPIAGVGTFIYLFVLPYKYPFMLVEIFEDRLTYTNMFFQKKLYIILK